MVEIRQRVSDFDEFSDKLLEKLKPKRYLKTNGFVSTLFLILDDSILLVSYDGNKIYIDIHAYGDTDPVELFSEIGSFDKRLIVVHYIER